MNYILGLTIVSISMMLGFLARDVNSILQWIVSGLYGGYIASNVLKWHWWRFNSHGFFWGMATGIASALIFPYFLPHVLPLYYFPAILAISTAGAISGSLLTPVLDMEVLKKFYKTIKPWGFWKPVEEEVKREDPAFMANRNFLMDMFNVTIGIVAQTSITALPVFLVLMMPMQTGTSAVVLIVCVAILWKTWYQKLPQN